MKLYLIIVLFSAFVSLSPGQTQSSSPTPATSPEKTKIFGSSLEKYEKKEQRDFQNKQKSDEFDDSETIRINTDLVVNDVLVTDQNGKIITDLKKDDFIVTENAVAQKIEVFSLGENPTVQRSIVLIINCSVFQTPYLENSIEAAKVLVDKLAPQDKMAIVTNDVKLRVDFTQDKTLLKNTLNSLLVIKDEILENSKKLDALMAVSQGKILPKKALDDYEKSAGRPNREFDALLAVLNEMFSEENRQRIIIFQGDGSEIVWLKTDNDAPYPISRSIIGTSGHIWVRKEKFIKNFGFSDVKVAIERSGTTIYSIIPGVRFLGFSKKEQKARAKLAFTNLYKAIGMRENLLPKVLAELEEAESEKQIAGQKAMLRVAELSGGFTGFMEKPEDAKAIYSNIFKQISNRYVIGYYPTNQARDGKRREVKVEVRNHPEYIVTGRTAYFPR
jgi:VWFA-related protein